MPARAIASRASLSSSAPEGDVFVYLEEVDEAGEARLKQVVVDGGFTRFRRATQTPFNLVFDVRR